MLHDESPDTSRDHIRLDQTLPRVGQKWLELHLWYYNAIFLAVESALCSRFMSTVAGTAISHRLVTGRGRGKTTVLGWSQALDLLDLRMSESCRRTQPASHGRGQLIIQWNRYIMRPC